MRKIEKWKRERRKERDIKREGERKRGKQREKLIKIKRITVLLNYYYYLQKMITKLSKNGFK